MRKEPFVVGDYIHVYNRGNRKMAIVKDEKDCLRFLSIIRYFNDTRPAINIFRDLVTCQRLRSNLDQIQFAWPSNWPVQKPIVKIISYCLMPNHYHLLLQEIISGGVSIFMKKLGNGFTAYMNIKYGESGKIFQGSYKSKTIEEEDYLQYLDFYIHLANPFEIYQSKNDDPFDFDKAFDFAFNYPYSSLKESLAMRNLGIIDRSSLNRSFQKINTMEKYKQFARSVYNEKGLSKFLGDLTLD